MSVSGSGVADRSSGALPKSGLSSSLVGEVFSSVGSRSVDGRDVGGGSSGVLCFFEGVKSFLASE